MRKVILLSGLVISIFSCSKNSSETSKTFCWECATNITMTIDGVPAQTANATQNICDKTEAEARQIEQSGTSTTTATNMGVSMKSVTKTSCTKK